MILILKNVEGKMNKKVGIITYKDINAGKGRYLQALALYMCIKNLGYDVEILDYYPAMLTSESSRLKRILQAFRSKQILLGYVEAAVDKIDGIITRKERRNQRSAYEKFTKENICMSKVIAHIDDIKKIESSYDAYVCGSDQIWNPFFSGLDPVYYLAFTSDEKKVSYAASIGVTDIPENILEMIGEHIRRIKHISVRESSAMDLLKEKLNIDACCVLDPTLAIEPDYWNTLTYNKEIPHHCAFPKYVLEIFFDGLIYPRKVSKRLAKKNTCEILTVPSALYDSICAKNKIWPKGPVEFLNVIKNATFVCTQSFHGVVFCLVFHIPFYVFPRMENTNMNGSISRIRDLLELVGLSDRIIDNYNKFDDLSANIDFTNADNIIERERRYSIGFLKKALDEIFNKIV